MLHFYQHSEKLPTEFQAHRLFQSEQLEVVHISLQPGEEIPVHQNNVDVLFFFISGSGIVTTAEEQSELAAGDLADISKGVQRGLKNHTSNELKVLVIKKMFQ